MWKSLLKIYAAGAAATALLVGGAFMWMTRSYSAPPGESVLDVIPGTWTWADEADGCRTDPQTITVAPDHRTMSFHVPHAFKGATGRIDSVWTYQIIRYDRSRVRARIIGEQRRTPAGVPVVWDLVLRSPNRFAWHRTDWSRIGFTGDNIRCPNGPEKPGHAAEGLSK